MNLPNVIGQTMTSIEIAEISGKMHKDVLEAIRTMEPAWLKVTGRKFPLSEYKDSTGRKLPMYELSKTECLYVATKFNDEARAKLVLRWESLEQNSVLSAKQATDLITSPEFIIQIATALKEAQNTAKIAIQEKQKAIGEMKKMEKKVEFAEMVIDADEMIDIGQAAKILELPFGRNTMFKLLKEGGILFGSRNEPKQEFVAKGYFKLKEKYIQRNNHEGFIVLKVLVTQKGLSYLHEYFNAPHRQTKLAKFRNKVTAN